jgi:putative restriction endonuclease
MARGKPWTHDELMVGMNLYCKLPFGQLRHGNPLVIEVAERLGRSPSSLSMKLCNLASLDPFHQERGIKGLSSDSRAARTDLFGL